MTQSFESSQPFGGRHEYATQSMEDKLEECELVTDMLDELLGSPYDSGGIIASQAHADDQEVTHFRSFCYLDTDKANHGWAWPLTEKIVDIRYVRTAGKLVYEQYHVAVGTRIHQEGISENPIMNVYQINYYGTNRQSVEASVDEPNIIGSEEFAYTTRTTTAYDHAWLFTELGHLTDMLSAQERENSYLGG